MQKQAPAGSHPARAYMLALGRELPVFWKACDEVRKKFSQPPESYLTDYQCSNALMDAIQAAHGHKGIESLKTLSPLNAGRMLTLSTTLACWRMTQGIYRIDPAIYAALTDTPITGDIPVDVLMHLPEWCIYVETPGLKIARRDRLADSDLRGFFARIDTDTESPDGLKSLVIALDIPDANGLQAQAIALKRGKSLREAISGAMAEWYTPTTEEVDKTADYLGPIVNLILYICTTAEISGKHGKPGNPAPVNTRRDGPRLFPADGPRTWDVGVRVGAALRAAYQAEQVGSAGEAGEHGSPRGHVRRAHWHGFRSGPRKLADGTEIPTAARKFELRWLPPIPVNIDDIDSMPAVVRVVK